MIKIKLCSNEIIHPREDEKLRIIQENHDSKIGSHKGILVYGVSNSKILVGGVYDPTGIAFDDFDFVITNTVSKYFDEVLLGDWNTDLCNSSANV